MKSRSHLDNSTSVTEFPGQPSAPRRARRQPDNSFSVMELMLALLLERLPSSTGTVSGPDGEGVYDITVSWADREGGDDSTRSVSFEVKPVS